jgi:hypothetical protein
LLFSFRLQKNAKQMKYNNNHNHNNARGFNAKIQLYIYLVDMEQSKQKNIFIATIRSNSILKRSALLAHLMSNIETSEPRLSLAAVLNYGMEILRLEVRQLHSDLFLVPLIIVIYICMYMSWSITIAT